jgi:hypothetical protein
MYNSKKIYTLNKGNPLNVQNLTTSYATTSLTTRGLNLSIGPSLADVM